MSSPSDNQSDEGPIALRQQIQRALILLFLLGGGIFLLYSHFFLFPLKQRAGELATRTVFAPVDIAWVDTQRLKELKGTAQEVKAFILDPSTAQEATEKIVSQFEEMSRIRSDKDKDGRISALAEKGPLSKSLITNLVYMSSDDKFEDIRNGATSRLKRVMQEPITENRSRVLKADSEFLTLPEQIAYAFVKRNVIPQERDGSMSDNEIRRLATRTLNKGEAVLRAGSRVNQEVLDKLSALGPFLARSSLYTFFGLVLLFLILVSFWAFYVSHFKKALYRSVRDLFYISSTLLLSAFLTLLLLRLKFDYSQYLLSSPIIFSTLILTSVFDPILALYAGVGLTSLTAIMLQFPSTMFLYALAGAILPPLLMHKRSTRREQTLFPLYMGIANVVLILLIILVSEESFSFKPLLLGFLSGTISSVVALGLIPVFEELASTLSKNRLNELLSPDQKLLNRLSIEAPGTYFHSVVVSEMAEAAAEAIGADSLLTKAGALYHDIGKLKRPVFFGENLKDLSVNPHRGIPPKTSYSIILRHVTDGLDLAKEYRLPKEIAAFIPEHHGTSIMKYFFHQAQMEDLEDPPEDSEFRYGGPKPRIKETGIVNLADICEATVRSRGLVDPDQISRTVREMILTRLNEGELSDCDLTVKEIRGIEEAFVKVLSAVYHQRVDYPQESLLAKEGLP